MKNWKKSLLIAAGLAVLIPTAAMATQKSLNQSDDMVTVEVKNVKGGALRVWYQGEWTDKTIPIGEVVKIPRNTELYIDSALNDISGDGSNLLWYSKKYGEDVKSYLKNLHISYEYGEEDFDIDNPEDEITWYATSDCVIEGEFEASLDVWSQGQDVYDPYYYVTAEYGKGYDGPSVVEVKLTATKEGKK